jgi:hypothetical protein
LFERFGRSRVVAGLQIAIHSMEATMAAKKTAAKRASKTKAVGRSVSKAAKRNGAAIMRTTKTVKYPVAETLRWVADGESLLIKWGAIQSPGAKRIAGTVAKILSVLEALTELRKA